MVTVRYAERVSNFDRPELPCGDPGSIELSGGHACPRLLPDMTKAAHEALTRFRSETLQYGPGAGVEELRSWVAQYEASDGVNVAPEQILIINGAKHGLDLACRVFLDPGDSVVVTNPTYMMALAIFRSHEADIIEVGQDDDGLVVEQLEGLLRERQGQGLLPPKLVYNVPEFHNPTGVTMSENRRRALVRAAVSWGFLIVEDDPYRRVRFEGVPVSPLKAFDRTGCVIGLGSFAKIVAPGLRVGWVAATPEIIRRMMVFKSDGGSCPLTQRIILEYCKQGMLEPHIRELSKAYALHRDVMLDALARYLPEAKSNRPKGGYYLWVALPEEVDSNQLLEAAIRRGVEFFPGRVFYPSSGPRNYLRLAYSYCTPDEIESGIQRLGQAFDDVTRA